MFEIPDKNKDEYYNSLFQKRPDEDREKMKFKDCSKTQQRPSSLPVLLKKSLLRKPWTEEVSKIYSYRRQGTASCIVFRADFLSSGIQCTVCNCATAIVLQVR
ncbi:hypothetical protein CEXT_338931 [Caerostris extrusa]|uniref:Uncharacterized protein n=1 Tax=Caerostris extrusa TaxID=172846 RepID=A0AAV4XJT7_CAEEX|nr:hypothetical protein CEXT_338931 [Caerostris extrusa]